MRRENARVDVIARTRHSLEGVRISANSATECKLFAGGRMLHVQGALIALHAHSLDQIDVGMRIRHFFSMDHKSRSCNHHFKLEFVHSCLYFVEDENNFINPWLQEGSGFNEKITGSG